MTSFRIFVVFRTHLLTNSTVKLVEQSYHLVRKATLIQTKLHEYVEQYDFYQLVIFSLNFPFYKNCQSFNLICSQHKNYQNSHSKKIFFFVENFDKVFCTQTMLSASTNRKERDSFDDFVQIAWKAKHTSPTQLNLLCKKNIKQNKTLDIITTAEIEKVKLSFLNFLFKSKAHNAFN